MTKLVEIKHERFIVDPLYNTENHLLRKPLYGDFGLTKCFAHPDLFEKLLKTTDRLKDLGLKLFVYDCYRPVAVQRAMWAILPDPRYIADPEEGSHHNRAVAVDCYLVKEDGTPLSFPTVPDGYVAGMEEDFDTWMTYLERAHHSHVCTPEEKELCQNRDLLRSIMEEAGFAICEEEWWHYELPNSFDYDMIELYTDQG